MYSNILSRRILHRIVVSWMALTIKGYCAPPIRGHTSRDTAAAICIRQRRALRIDVKICSKISPGNAGIVARRSSFRRQRHARIIVGRAAYNLKNVSFSALSLPPLPPLPCCWITRRDAFLLPLLTCFFARARSSRL